MPGPNHLSDALRVLKALRRGPVTVPRLAAELGLLERKVYRLVEQLELAGAPIARGEIVHEDGGRPAATLRITADGLRRWLG